MVPVSMIVGKLPTNGVDFLFVTNGANCGIDHLPALNYWRSKRGNICQGLTIFLLVNETEVVYPRYKLFKDAVKSGDVGVGTTLVKMAF